MTCALTAHAETYNVDVSKKSFTLYMDPYNGNQVQIGGFSAMIPVPGDPNRLYVITDRGPGADYVDPGLGTLKMFVQPKFGPHILTVRLLPNSRGRIEEVKPLKIIRGEQVTGLPNTMPPAEVPYDVNLEILPNDEDALDTEGLTMDAWGNFWVCEEYKSSIAMVLPNGVVALRLVPKGTLMGTERIPSFEVLPAVCSKRVNNRGLEGITYTPNGRLYAIFQRPLANPDLATSEGDTNAVPVIKPSCNTRLVEVNLVSLLMGGPEPVVRQLVYRAGSANNKVYASDIFALSCDTFLVPERKTDKLFAINIAKATDITPLEDEDGSLRSDPTKTLEMLDAAGLAALGVVPVTKKPVIEPLTGVDKVLSKCEGVCVRGQTIFLTHDNDFNIQDATPATDPYPGGPAVEVNLQDPPNFPRVFTAPLPEIVFP
jgi:hypothetical protein